MKNRIINFLKKFGFFTDGFIRAYWWPGEDNRNFGDIITPYLIKKITNKNAILVNRRCLKDYYMVTGSILSLANKKSIIWGSGIMHFNQKIKKPKKIFAVRGPLSRKKLLQLGFSCPEIYGDPALLLPVFYKPKINKKYELGIIPHYVDYKEIKSKINNKNVLIIDLLSGVENVIDSICSCERTISSSLHGIIASHAYNVPSLWVEFSKKITGDGTKYKDYFLSVGIDEYKPIDLIGKEIKIEELIKLIDKKHRQKIKIDIYKLLNSCPFRNN